MMESLSGRLRIINYLLILIISIAILFLMRNIITLLTLKIDSKTINITDTTKNEVRHDTKDINSYAVILEKNPFGKPMKLLTLIETEGIKKDDIGTSTDLILIGTAVGPKGMSYAVFELPDGKGQEVFRIGEDVFNYGSLTGIGRDYINLRQGSNTITVKMMDKSSATETQPRSEALAGSFVKKISERDYLINKEKVEQSLENPQQILTDARLLPNIQNGKQEGFRVLEVKPGGLYESLGLKNGDILLRINGIDISSPDVAIQAISAFKGMNRVNLDIMRDGSKLSMNYQIR